LSGEDDFQLWLLDATTAPAPSGQPPGLGWCRLKPNVARPGVQAGSLRREVRHNFNRLARLALGLDNILHLRQVGRVHLEGPPCLAILNVDP
jgi:hypothetical protein